MKFTLSWLHEALGAKPSADEVAKVLTSVGIEVANIRNLVEGFEQVVVGKIEGLTRHPNADKLTLCDVVDGPNRYRVVCGAKNHKSGDKVALAKVGAKLPNGLTIKKSKIRGEESEGMLCSESELGLSEESEGILILPPETSLGEPLANVLKRNDTVIEVEVTPNRGDCLSVLGIAREAAAALKIQPKLPLSQGEGPGDGAVKASVVDVAGCARYVLRRVEGLTNGVSPEAMRNRLEASGVRSISAIVDVTNYVMLEWGQPLHAFDAAKLVGAIQVRRAKAEEKIICLDDVERALTEDDLVIADDQGPIALAGVMGGARTAVDSGTKTILLESAHFDPKTVRKTARRLGLHSESSHRFERFVDPTGVWAASSRAVALLSETAGGKETDALDLRAKPTKPRSIVLRRTFVVRILGECPEDAGELLARIGLSVEKLDDGWKVEIPARRWDLEREIDLVEEVARMHGYEEFATTLPALSGEPNPSSEFEQLDRLKSALKAAGIREVRGYSFATEEQLKQFPSISLGNAVAVANPLTSDMAFLRQSLLPSLLSAWKMSASRQAKGARFFEIGRVFGKGPDARGNPSAEETHLAILFAGNIEDFSWHVKERHADLFDAKGILEFVADEMGWPGLSFRRIQDAQVFHGAQAADILWRNVWVGSLGILHPRLSRSWDVGTISAAVLRLDPLLAAEGRPVRFKPLSAFPTVERDLAFLLPADVEADQLTKEISKLQDPLLKEASFFDVYEGKGVPKGQISLAIHLFFGLSDRTLTDAEVDASISKIVKQMEKAFQAKLRA